MTFATDADLADPELHRQLRTVAFIHTRRRPWLAPEYDSAVNLALCNAWRLWRPGMGSNFRSYATLAAHRACRDATRRERPKGYRFNRERVSAPGVGSIDGTASILASIAAPDAEGPEPDAAEIVARALEAAGEDAALLVGSIVDGRTLEELGRENACTREWVRQRIARGIKNARKARGLA